MVIHNRGNIDVQLYTRDESYGHESGTNWAQIGANWAQIIGANWAQIIGANWAQIGHKLGRPISMDFMSLYDNTYNNQVDIVASSILFTVCLKQFCSFTSKLMSARRDDDVGTSENGNGQVNVNINVNDREETMLVRPFEWLTSPSSLEPFIEEYVIRPLLASSSSSLSDGEMNYSVVRESTTTESATMSRQLRRPQLRRPLQALHIGCGSSTLGEYLVTDLAFDRVVNVDMDEETMVGMEARWRRKCDITGSDCDVSVSSGTLNPIHPLEQQRLPLTERLEFLVLDFTKESLPHPRFDNAFDLVLDKSTLDCTLCSDTATASLLVEVYRSLHENGGVYIVISFHEVDLLLPLLRDLPGAHWTVDHMTMDRHVERIFVNPSEEFPIETKNKDVPKNSHQPLKLAETSSDDNNVKVEELDDTRKKLNVFIARKTASPPSSTIRSTDSLQPSETNHSELNFDAVCLHVHEVNNRWFQERNPLLTAERIESLKRAFGVLGSDNTDEVDGWHGLMTGGGSKLDLSQQQSTLLSLEQAYDVLFTDAEREHLTFEYFLQDWHAYQHELLINNNSTLDDGTDDILGSCNSEMISFDVAVEFLRVTQ